MSRSKIYNDADYYLAGKIAEKKYGQGLSHSIIAHDLKIDYYKVNDIVRNMHRGGPVLINIHLQSDTEQARATKLFCEESKLKLTKWGK